MRQFLFAAILTGALLPTFAFGQVPSSSTKIQVTTASWGYAGQRADVKAQVVKFCEGLPSCKFMVNVKTLSDPAPGESKGMIVSWKCGETAHRDAFPQNKPAELKCP